MSTGIGDRYDQAVAGRRVVVHQQAAKDGLKFKYMALWLTPGWKEWVTKEQLLQIAKDGYTPLLVYYTFGDRSSREYLEADGGARLKAWHKDITENLGPLADIGSEVLIALEPEFNIIPASGTPLSSWPGWFKEVGRAIDALHRAAPMAKVGLCPGNWGNRDLVPVMSGVAAQSDFIAFPEMRAASDPTVDAKSRGYLDVAGAAVEYSAYLKESFGKPLLIAYLALSSYADGNPRGWEREQARIIKGLFDREAELVQNGVFGLVYFAYFDDPGHGTEFFGEAERHFGLKDERGRPKKAWRVWKNRSR